LNDLSEKTIVLYILYTVPETNKAPENGWLELRSFPVEIAYFQGRATF